MKQILIKLLSVCFLQFFITPGQKAIAQIQTTIINGISFTYSLSPYASGIDYSTNTTAGNCGQNPADWVNDIEFGVDNGPSFVTISLPNATTSLSFLLGAVDQFWGESVSYLSNNGGGTVLLSTNNPGTFGCLTISGNTILPTDNGCNGHIYISASLPFTEIVLSITGPYNVISTVSSTVSQCDPAINLTNNVSICGNQTYQLPSGTIVSTAGIYSDTVRNQAATCDSIISTINLSVYSLSLVNTEAHICPGQTYQLSSGIVVSEEGIYSDTLRNQASCDSVINNIQLFIDNVSSINTAVHICPGQTYQLPSGTIISAEGIYLDTLRSQASCDSIINTIQIYVDHSVLLNSEIHICPNQTYQLPSGLIVGTQGIYADTVRSQFSCDSIINIINLMVDHTTLLNQDVIICSNQNYVLPSGTIVSTGGIYADTIRSQASCDSIINVIHLMVNDISQSNQVDSIYEGQTYLLPSGVTVSSPGTYQSILANSLGCDSVINTTLNLRKSINECMTLKNAITPNGDAINDYWVLYRYRCFKKLGVDIYNRYGSRVYHSDDYQNDWNGKYNNKELPDGTYYYVMNITTYDGKIHTYRNNVTILR